MNINKTMIISNGKERTLMMNTTVNEEQVTSFSYHGHVITDAGRGERDIKKRACDLLLTRIVDLGVLCSLYSFI